jgi:large-conductance mechanosensitive channel
MEVKMVIFLSILIIIIALCNFFLIREISKLKKVQNKPKLSKEEREKLEKAREAFNNLMEYDYYEAMKRK